MIFNLYLCTKFGAINSLLTIKTNKTLTEILMRSDFAIKVSFYDIKGKAITLKKFKLSYSTQLSTPIIATFDGTTYSDNCTPTDNGVIIQFNNPMLNIGILKVIREFTIESSVFSDGVRDIRQQETLPIEIVQSYSRSGSQAAQPTSITSPQDDLLCIDNVILDSQIGPQGEVGEQGLQGPQGLQGIPGNNTDYSILTEQECVGEFFVDFNGFRKQLYTRTFISEGIVCATQYGTFAQLFSVNTGATGILSANGIWKYGKEASWTTINSIPIVNTQNNAPVFAIPFIFISANSIIANVNIAANGIATSQNGIKIFMKVNLKYTK